MFDPGVTSPHRPGVSGLGVFDWVGGGPDGDGHGGRLPENPLGPRASGVMTGSSLSPSTYVVVVVP